MNSRLLSGLIAGMVLMMGTSSWVSAKSGDPGDGSYTSADRELYLTESELAFIRPGLVLEILDVVIPSDLQPEVTFKITDPAGLPLDRAGIFTPGPVSTSFILSFIPEASESYVAYTTRVQTSPITDESAVQASTDSGGTYTDLGLLTGTYMYKFATVLPADYDTNATHTLGIYARRDLLEFDLDRYVANELDHFIPSGAGTPEPRDIVTTETCNGRCHDPLALHGGARQEVGLCILCHNETQSIDPDTGDSVDMPYMTHKIHAGVHLENGYTIVGYRQAVHDYSHVEYPAILNDCELCHTGGIPTGDFPMVANPNTPPVCDASGYSMTEITWGDEGNIRVHVDAADGSEFASGGGAGSSTTGKWVDDGKLFFLVDAASGDVIQQQPVDNTVFGCANNPPGTFRGEPGVQHTTWMTNPTRKDCGSCHDNINWETGENHAGGDQDDDSLCSTCHVPTTGVEFDRSVEGAHTVEYKSNQLGGILVEILDIENTDPGDRPTVTFSLSDKWGPLNPATLDRMQFSLSGPNTDFSFYVQENVMNELKQVGSNWEYHFDAKLPADAMGSFTLGIEGRADAVLNGGENNEMEVEDQMQNFAEGFAVTDTITDDRRMVVDDAKCESCHGNLSLHGDNRNDGNTYCQTCHQPAATDAAVRPADAGPNESIHFKYMIHKIHRGQELENGFIVYGYRGSLHDYSHVEYSGDLRNCEACHVDDSYTLPLPDGMLDTPESATSILLPLMPEASACLSCHDNDSAAVHADSNSTDLGEACATCHGTGKEYSVEKVHAR
jgi:hypothetical protein